MVRRILNIVIFILVCNITLCYGQTEDFRPEQNLDSTRLFLGISTGYQNVIHEGVGYQFVDEYCPTNINKVYGDGFNFGLNFKYFFATDSVLTYPSLILKLLFEYSHAYHNPYQDKNPFDDIKSLEGSRTYFSVDIDLLYFTVCFLYSQSLGKKFPLSFVAGPTFSFLTYNNFKQVYHLYNKTTNQFQDSTIYEHIDVISYNKEIQHTIKIIPGIQFGISYEIKIADKIQIIPELNYHWYLVSVVKDHSWNMSNFKVGISLLYAIN